MDEGGDALLALTRKRGQSIMIGNEIEVTVIEVRGDQVRLGVRAPRHIPVHRLEVFNQICLANQEAATQLDIAQVANIFAENS